MSTTNQQLADWIQWALGHPQVIEDLQIFIYPSDGNYIVRRKRYYARYYHPVLSPKYEKMPLPEPKPGFDSNKPAISADILGLALIGKLQDIEAAWQAYRRYPGREVFRAFSELLDIPVDLCLRLTDWHAGGVTTAKQISDMLRANAF